MQDEREIWYSQREALFKNVAATIAEELQEALDDNGIQCIVESEILKFRQLEMLHAAQVQVQSFNDELIKVEIRLFDIDQFQKAEALIEQLHTIHSSSWLPQSINGNPVRQLTCVIPPQAMPEGWVLQGGMPNQYRIRLNRMSATETLSRRAKAATSETDSGAAPSVQPIDLLLSGGGYRATVFHLGVLRFLYEHSMTTDGTSALSSIRRVIGISGGSITAADLAFRLNDYKAHFSVAIASIRKLVTTVDARREVLVRGKTLSQVLEVLMPDQADFSTIQTTPELYILGTNYQSGGIVCFSNQGLKHFKLSHSANGALTKENVVNPLHLKLRHAVAASAAFPPFLPPVQIRPELFSVTPKSEELGAIREHEVGDGGIRDNLGAEFYVNAFGKIDQDRVCIVSDAGLVFDWSSKAQSTQNFESWLNRLTRVTDIQMNRLWRMDLQQLGNVHYPSLADWTCADANEEYARQAFDQPLTKAVARLAAQSSTDLVPFTEAEFYAILRLGYDTAKRTLKEPLQLVSRGSQIPDAYFWSEIFPKQVVKLNDQTTREGKSLESALHESTKDQIRSASEAIEHLPISNNERVLLKRLAWIRMHKIAFTVQVLIVLLLAFGLGFLIARRIG